jgi:diacylglycerol kinase (ATP)
MDSSSWSTTGLTRITKAFANSMAGLGAAWRHESSVRQLSVLALVLVPVACVVQVTPAERVLLIGSVVLAIVVELLNSGIEATVDRISLERHELSKRAKDIGSAAVFVALVLVALAWALILLPRYA